MPLKTASLRQRIDKLEKKADALHVDLGESEPEPTSYSAFPQFITERLLPAIKYVEGEAETAVHLELWAKRLETNKRTVTLAPRGHLKSTLFYGYLAWRLDSMKVNSVRGLYLSYKRELAQEHLQLAKEYISACQIEGVQSVSSASSILRYRKGKYFFEIKPEGVLAASRGRHLHIMLLDDVLKDPRNPLRFDEVIDITRSFQHKIIPMLRGVETVVHIAGTPVVEGDLLHYLRDVPNYDYGRYPAIDVDGKVLWPEVYDIEFLAEIEREIGTKAFENEYLLKAVAPLNSYIDPERLDACICRS